MPRRKKKHHVREEFWLVFAIVLGVMFGFCAALVMYAPTIMSTLPVFIGMKTSTESSLPRIIVPGEAARVQLISDMRQLWSADVMWTRQYISAYAAGTGDYQEAFSRLQQNNDAIVSTLATYYGSNVEPTIGVAMKERTGLMSDYLAAAKKGEKAIMADVDAKWQAKSEEIGKQLNALGATGVDSMGFDPRLYEYQTRTIAEIKSRIAKK
jgi:hypothetical protein